MVQSEITAMVRFMFGVRIMTDPQFHDLCQLIGLIAIIFAFIAILALPAFIMWMLERGDK